MQAFKEGFISVDDLQRRNVSNIATNDQLKTQLQASDFQRRLAPGAFQNAQAAQGLQASQIQAATQLQPGQLTGALGAQEILAADQAARLQAQVHESAAASNAESERQAEQLDQLKREHELRLGSPAPKSFDITVEKPALPYDQWLEEEHGKELKKAIDNFQPGVPDTKDREQIIATMVDAFMPGVNTQEANIARSQYEKQTRAEMESVPQPEQLQSEFEQKTIAEFRENPAFRQEFANYQAAQKNQKEKLTPEDPRYAQILWKRINVARQEAGLDAAKLKAVPDLLKAAAEAPGKAAEAQNKAQGDVLMELHKSEELKRFGPQFEAFAKVDAVKNSGRVPTAADDISALYLFVKVLDPTSAVREGEVDLAKSTNPYVINTYNRLKAAFDTKDKIVSDSARKELFATLDTLKQGALATAAPEIKRISNIANDRGVPLDQVFTGPYRAVLSGSSSPSAAPAVSKPSPTGTRRVVPTSGPYSGKTLEWTGSGWTVVQ